MEQKEVIFDSTMELCRPVLRDRGSTRWLNLKIAIMVEFEFAKKKLESTSRNDHCISQPLINSYGDILEVKVSNNKNQVVFVCKLKAVAVRMAPSRVGDRGIIFQFFL